MEWDLLRMSKKIEPGNDQASGNMDKDEMWSRTGTPAGQIVSEEVPCGI